MEVAGETIDPQKIAHYYIWRRVAGEARRHGYDLPLDEDVRNEWNRLQELRAEERRREVEERRREEELGRQRVIVSAERRDIEIPSEDRREAERERQRRLQESRRITQARQALARGQIVEEDEV